MRAAEIIAKKRDGETLTRDEISFIIAGYTAGETPDYQMAALLMAIYLRGMNSDETIALTRAMLESGAAIDFTDLGRVCIDKHSTGGVGDKTSLVVAPVVAAAGVPVPMISGRALAHSGGTLDKLESIPGFRTQLTLTEFRDAVRRIGAALIGQTPEICPADRKIYNLRDVTSTVACPPLMAASIMSKKLAEGIDGLVLDVKYGTGAFLKEVRQASALAETMIQIGRSMGKRCVALISDMNQPLGRTIGNSLEVIEAFDTLKGRGPADLDYLCAELASEMLVLGRAATSIEDGRRIYHRMIDSGAALEKLRQILRNQGGNERAVDDYDLLPASRRRKAVKAEIKGHVTAIDAEAVGRASMILGAGRLQLDSKIDYSVGIVVEAKIGDWVDADSAIGVLHFNNDSLADEATTTFRSAYTITEIEPEPRALIHSILR